MNDPEIKAGVSLLYYGTGPAHDVRRAHIHVIVKDDIDKGNLLLVPISSQHQNCDKTCLFPQSCGWTALSKPSFVAYYTAKMVSRKATIDKIMSSEITYLGMMPDRLFEALFVGIKRSPETEPWFLKHF